MSHASKHIGVGAQTGSPILTTAHGAPIDDNQNSLTVNPRGPILISDINLIDKLAHFDRERIPERVVHAKGAGAHGFFEVTHDVTRYTRAKFLSKIGKRTPVFVRFSTVGGEKGSSDAARDPRGFAIKHYTEDGIYDMVGNNTPIFFIRDPEKFPDFIHTQKRNPQTNVKDPDAFWDFASLVPESVHQFSFLFSDRGIPASHRHMDGFSSHTWKWVNASGEGFWVKLHYKTDAGIQTFTAEEAAELEKTDLDHSTRDLFNHIAKGNIASWTAYIQIMPLGDEVTYKWNVFDITKVWPHSDYPLIPYGRLVLDKNPDNYFAEVEQAAFSPSHLVPGIEPSFDRMLMGRLFSYADTHRHRLGANYLQIPINCPYASRVLNQQRDGPMAVNGNFGSAPNYEPNSLSHSHSSNNPVEDRSGHASVQAVNVNGMIGRYPYDHPNSDFEQPAMFWNKVLNEDQRRRLVSNIGGHLCHARAEVQERMVKVFTLVDKEYGRRVQEELRKHTAAKL